MTNISLQDVKAKLEALAQTKLWVIGQRRWTMALARGVLAREAAVKAKNACPEPGKYELGLVFLEDMSQFDFNRIGEFDRLFFFNREIQIQFRRDESSPDTFQTATSEDCNDMETVWPKQINSRMKEYRFAALLGSIPDAKIGIKFCTKHRTWRFYHE